LKRRTPTASAIGSPGSYPAETRFKRFTETLFSSGTNCARSQFVAVPGNQLHPAKSDTRFARLIEHQAEFLPHFVGERLRAAKEFTALRHPVADGRALLRPQPDQLGIREPETADAE
jgi:hypothetical protein